VSWRTRSATLNMENPLEQLKEIFRRLPAERTDCPWVQINKPLIRELIDASMKGQEDIVKDNRGGGKVVIQDPVEPPIQRFKESEDHSDIEWKLKSIRQKYDYFANRFVAYVLGVITGLLLSLLLGKLL